MSNIHLPNGHTVSVTPVFGGLNFKSVESNARPSPFPPGWTIVIHSEHGEDDAPTNGRDAANEEHSLRRKRSVHRFREPTLHHDHLFISSISNPANTESKSTGSPARQMAMMLWTTLWWYFHQTEPDPRLYNASSKSTAEAGRPKGEWRVYINREGIFKGKHLIQKLERMGLICNEDSSVGINQDEATSESWSRMFVSKQHFWQLDPRLYLFAYSPAFGSSFGATPSNGSRPGSPNRPVSQGNSSEALVSRPSTPLGHSGTTDPFNSSSQLPTYFPPPPAQYVFTNNIRHPLRPKPPRQGETFYTRFIPSLGEYLSFRVASLSPHPVAHAGPVHSSASLAHRSVLGAQEPLTQQNATSTSTIAGASDVELLHKWMNDPRVAYSWGEDGPIEHQREFLEGGLKNKHSMPVIGCFDGKPFAYFEIYWVKEDRLGAYLGGTAGDHDRGLHLLVGEQEFRGGHRVKVWLSALIHYCWLADSRTQAVMLEPRVDNDK